MEASQAPTMSLEEEAHMIAALSEAFDLACNGDALALAALIGHGMRPNMRNEKGDTLAMLATHHGHADLLRTLLEAGASPAQCNAMGQTPITDAACKGFKDIIDILLAHGAVDGGDVPAHRDRGSAARARRQSRRARQPGHDGSRCGGRHDGTRGRQPIPVTAICGKSAEQFR